MRFAFPRSLCEVEWYSVSYMLPVATGWYYEMLFSQSSVVQEAVRNRTYFEFPPLPCPPVLSVVPSAVVPRHQFDVTGSSSGQSVASKG